MRITPKSPFSFPRLGLQHLPPFAKGLRTVASVDPCVASIDQFLIDQTLKYGHQSHRPAISIGVNRLDLYHLPKNHTRGKLLRFGTECLA